MRVRVTLEGVDRLLAESRRIGGDVERKALRAMHTAVLDTERDTKLAAPVDTGRLRASYHSSLDARGGTVGTSVHYAPYLEYGTRYMAARPHLFPAARRHAARLLGRLQQIIRNPDRA